LQVIFCYCLCTRIVQVTRKVFDLDISFIWWSGWPVRQ